MQWTWCHLDVSDGHLVGGRVTVPGMTTKNGEPLVLPIVGGLRDVLDRRWQARVSACPFVFHRNGQPVVRFDLAWDAACAAIGYGGRDAAGQRPLRFHDLRRSAAVLLRQAGVDPAVIKARGGWKTDGMSTRYSALFDEREQVGAQEALDAALDSPGPRRVVPLRRHG